ncbi:uncharacterized protein LOC131213349 [Anopheles bellator]|uniref:uncharacterized protein LOC131213349 n=1 Tax=Anopheles bellator TaxID=139047 RepID=UPI0026471CD5|nr:uncharacterized protein LOC131213349 [Anopheles bellator]
MSSSMSPIAVIVMCALVVSSDTESTSPASTSQSASPLTINKCDQRGDRTVSHTDWSSDASKNLPDCRCPPGYTAILQYGEPSQKVLCASLRSAAPWSEGCVSSGSSTDYYDLGAIELRLVRLLLRAANVSEVWISARRLTPFGALVRRLPGGDRWNAPVELTDQPDQPDQPPGSDDHPDPGQLRIVPTAADFNCGAIGGPNYEQIFLANCSRALPQLCLFRETTLLQLHCRQREFTTRYGEGQGMCYTVLASDDRALSALSGVAESEYRILDVDSGRKKQLLDDLLNATAAHRKHCAQTYFTDQRDNSLRSLALSIRDAVQRAVSGPPSNDSYMREQNLRQMALDLWRRYDCAAVQRNTSVDHGADGPVRAMYLYFDRARYRLYLTVYGRQWFWREKPSANGFQCYTNADAEQMRRVQVRPIRTSRKRSRRAHPRSSESNAPETDDHDTGQRSMYELTLVDGIPSYYWCEAHVVPNLTHLVSPTVLANRKSNGKTFFSVTVDVSVLDRSVETMRLKDYTRLVKDQLKRARARVLPETKRVLDTIKTVQVMKSDHLGDAFQPDNRTAARLIVHLVMRQVNFKSDFPEFAEINEIELPDAYVRYYRTRRYLQDALRLAATDEFRFVGVNSTEYCLPDSLQLPSADSDGNVWWVARLGETATPRNLCLPEGSDLPLTRRCLGDYLHGCAWDRDAFSGGHCSSAPGPETRALYEYSTAPLNGSLLPDIFSTVGHVLSAPDSVLPVDLFYIAQVLDNLRNVLLLPASAEQNGVLLAALNKVQHYCDVADIMSRVMYVNETIVTRAQRVLNTTNILLYVTEAIVNQLVLAENASMLLQGAQYECGRRTLEADSNGPAGQPVTNGTVLFRSPRLIVLIADPAVGNVSGVALFRQIDGGDDHGEDFNSYTIRYLYANQSLESLVAEPDLEIGAFIPQSVIENLGALHDAMTLEEQPESETEPLETPPLPPPPLRVVLTIYYNDHAFRETRAGPVTRSSAKIISISIPGYGSRMPGEVPFYARETRTHNRSAASASHCGYWSFETDPAGTDGFGRWAFDECRLIDGSGPVALCGCYHLTSFSRLTMDTQLVESVGVSQKFIADQGTLALDLITAIGCSLSLLGVVGILATGILFPAWRAKASSKILLQLSGAIAIEMIIIFLEGPDIDQHRVSRIKCALLGSVFHYIILVTFMWMLLTAYLQFMRYVKVLGRLRPSHVILKATVLCWGAPLVPVATYLASDYTLYLKRDNLTDICYPHGDALWFGLMLPIAAIVFFNLVSFVVVLYHICAIPANLSKQTDRDLTLAQLRLSVFLFFLLGLPWIFGMLTTGTEDKLFAYLFCLTAPVQGFVLFLYFIVIDPVARRLWLGRLRRCRCIAGDRSATGQLDEKETTTLPSTTLNTQL